MPRFHCPVPLAAGEVIDLPPGAARHVQVLRLQPGARITLFHGEPDGPGGEFEATVTRMGRSDVQVLVGAHHAIEREAPRAVHLLAGLTANERMDWLVEKAAELGAASVTPILAARSVLKLKGERGDKKRAHWQAVAVAACEQSGRTRVPQIAPVRGLAEWLAALPSSGDEQRLVLSLRDARPLHQGNARAVLSLSGPEGGLAEAEEDAARRAGFTPLSLGPRTLRADTAPLALLARLGAAGE